MNEMRDFDRIGDGYFDAADTTPIAVALDWVRRGFPVFPCGPDKRPLIGGGFKGASQDPEQVAEWWRQHARAMVGLPTGQRSGMFVIDLDVDKETGEALGEATLRRLGLQWLLGSTPGVTTPSGGRHLYFAHAPGLGCTVGKIGPGVDTRGEGGYVVAGGSVAPTGAYVMQVPVSLSTLRPVPAAILDALRPAPRASGPSIDTGLAGLQSDEPASAGEVAEILRWIPADLPYSDWVGVLMGLHAHFGGSQQGLALADQWSATGAKYVPGEVQAKWAGFKSGGVSFGTVCAQARANGADLSLIARKHRPQAAKVARIEDFRAGRIQQAEPDQPGPDAPDDAGEYFCAADLAGQPVPPREWEVQDFVPKGTVTMLNGDGGAGKSLLAVQLAFAVATGGDWIGQEVKPGRALYISAEDDRAELHRRLADVSAATGVDLADATNLTLRSLSAADALLAVLPPGGGNVLARTGLLTRIDAWMAQHRPRLTVLDTLADLFGGNEIDRTQARQFIGMLRELCARHGTTILLLAHPSLSGMQSGSGSSGSTAWSNSVRSRLYLTRAKAEDGGIPDPDLRTLEVMKANYGRIGQSVSLRWQEGFFVPESTGEGALDRMARGAKARRVFTKLLREYAEQGRHVSHNPGPTYAPSVFAKDPGAEGCTRRILGDAMNALFADGAIRVETHGTGAKARSHLARSNAGATP